MAQQVGLQPEQYNLVCMDYTPMVNDLTDPNGNCDLAAGDVGVSQHFNGKGEIVDLRYLGGGA